MSPWPLFAIAIVLLSLAGFVHRADPGNPVHRRFAAYTILNAVYAGAIAGLYIGGPAWFWARVSFAAATLIPPSFLAFIDYYPRRSAAVHRGWRFALWVASIAFAGICVATPLIMADINLVGATPYRTTGAAYPVFAAYFLAAWSVCLGVLYGKYRATRGAERAAVRYVAGAILVSVTGAILTNLIHPLITGRSTYSWLGPYCAVAYIALIAHAIIRHRVMDLRFFIHHGVTFAIAVTVSLLPVAALLAIIGPRLWVQLSPAEIIVELIAIVAVALLVPVVRDVAGRLLDRYVYRRHADYQRTVREASRELTRVLHLKTLINFMQTTMVKAVECDGVALYLRRGDALRRANFQQRHESQFLAPMELPQAIRAQLEDAPDAIVTDELPRAIGGTASDLHEELSTLNWAVVLPTVSENSPIGAIVLGPKLSGDPYYPQDLDLLMTLANQAGIAIKNAQLYAQIVLANEYLENIVATINSGVVALDAEGTVTMFNPAAEQLTGMREDHARGKPAAVLPPSLRGALEATLADGFARTQPDIELFDGAVTRPVMCTTSPLRDPDGTLLGAVAVFSDLTPVRQLELERRRAERLAYLETFASGIAHEVKNPLVAIKTFVQLIPRRREDKRFVEEFSRVVGREIGRMERLVGRLRTLSRPGQRPRIVLDVRQPLVDALEFMQAACEDKNLRVDAALGEVEAPVLGDSNELEQLFLNLLMNAHEATPRGGRIAVAIALADSCVSVAVTDSGPGIPADALGRVFEPFFTTKERGSGLGLAICAGIADTHGARVRAENVHAGGARFTVEFPLASEVSVPVTS